MINKYVLGLDNLNLTNQIGGFFKPTRLCKEETNSDYHKSFYIYNVTKLKLFADAPVRQNGDSANVREFLIRI